MKDFLKFTFATITGIIVSVVVLVFISILVVFSMVSSSESETQVRKNSIMMLDLNGALAERSQDNPFDALMGDNYKTYGLDDILSSIKKAKENDDIKGIYIEATSLGAGFASREEIRNALKDFKESGKFIVAYGDSYSQGLYYLSSVADKVLLNPQGMVEGLGRYPHVLQGFAGQNRSRNADIQSRYLQIGCRAFHLYRNEPCQP